MTTSSAGPFRYPGANDATRKALSVVISEAWRQGGEDDVTRSFDAADAVLDWLRCPDREGSHG